MKKLDRKIVTFQGIRALAFISIYLTHVGTKYGIYTRLSVIIFFTLSGYLMYSKYENVILKTDIPSLAKFGVSKIKRIYPLHIIIMFMALPLVVGKVLVMHIGGGASIAVKVALHIFLIQSWVPIDEYANSLNGPAWYLSVTLFLYSIFPLLLKLLKNINEKIKVYFFWY